MLVMSYAVTIFGSEIREGKHKTAHIITGPLFMVLFWNPSMFEQTLFYSIRWIYPPESVLAMLAALLLVHHSDPDRNVSATIGWYTPLLL